jgi:nanoRNase/pAp phosphatase (c-di-AMP/oligoRNAs hydrolase)
MYIQNHLVPCASIPYTLSSEACHQLLQDNPQAAFSACYWDTVTHRIFSLRSSDDRQDVSEIAKVYGGGGHRNSAGFRVPRDHALAMF